MQKLVAVACCALLFVSGCVTAKAISPPPVLAPVETKNQDVTSKGGPLTPGELFVCADLGQGMTCIEYQLFQENLRQQLEAKHPLNEL